MVQKQEFILWRVLPVSHRCTNTSSSNMISGSKVFLCKITHLQCVYPFICLAALVIVKWSITLHEAICTTTQAWWRKRGVLLKSRVSDVSYREKQVSKSSTKNPHITTEMHFLSLVHSTGKIHRNELLKKTEAKSSISPISTNDKII